MVYTNAVEAGNKIIANTAQVSMFGKKRSAFSRLTKTVQPRDSTIFVSAGLDWVAGDKLGIFPTNIRFEESDYAIIQDYNQASG